LDDPRYTTYRKAEIAFHASVISLYDLQIRGCAEVRGGRVLFHPSVGLRWKRKNGYGLLGSVIL
jgi:hypothetical protein